MTRRSHHALTLLVTLCLPFGSAARASELSPGSAILRDGFRATYFDVSPPLRDLAANVGPAPADAPIGPAGDLHAAAPALPPGPGMLAMPAPLFMFDAFPSLNFLYPSPSMDVGPDHVVVMANARFAIFDKSGSGVALLGPVANNTLWAGFGGLCEIENSGQPNVVYDQFADRWLLSQATALGPTVYLCVAVSTTGDPTGSYYRWSFSVGTDFADIPRYAVWPDAYHISTLEFANLGTGPPVGVGAYVLHRGDMVAGVPSPRTISVLIPYGTTPYNISGGLNPADLDGSAAPPAGSAAYYLGAMDAGGLFYGAPLDAIAVWRFHVDFDVPANSTFTHTGTLPVSTYDTNYPCPGGWPRCVPQPGVPTTQYLDNVVTQRFLGRVTYRNFGTHQSLVANQAVEAAPAMTGIRWYELRDSGAGMTVHQQGTHVPGATDGIHRWNGSVAMDHDGNMALAYSVTSATTFPGIRYTGRLAGDPSGTMPQGEGVIVDGTGVQTSTSNRWGLYSDMTVDPSDECTFWHVNQHYPVSSAFGWSLRVAAFKYPGCSPLVAVEEDRSQAPASRLHPMGAARGPVEVWFTLAGEELREVRIEILDVTGRRVRRLMAGTLAGGSYRVEWDRTDDAGRRLRPGVYHVRLLAGSEQDAEGVILLR